MKKFLFLFCLLAFPFFSDAAEYEDGTGDPEIIEYSVEYESPNMADRIGFLLGREYSVQARVAWFHPEETIVRRIYGRNWAEYAFEVETPFSCHWSVWLNGSYYNRKGHSTGLSYSTQIKHQAYNLGVKHYFRFLSQKPLSQRMRPYLGLGIGAAQVHFHDQSPYVVGHTNRWGFTILTKAGMEVDIYDAFFLDLFVDYTYEWFHFKKHHGVSRHDVNPGGVKTGVGLGYRF